MPGDKVTLTFQCPACKKIHQGVKQEMTGHKVRCQCGFVFRLGPKSGEQEKSKSPSRAGQADSNSKRSPNKKSGTTGQSETRPLTPSKYARTPSPGTVESSKPGEGLTLVEPQRPDRGLETVVKSGTEPSSSKEDRLTSFPANYSPIELEDRFGKYEVLLQLGEGGMGIVYLCRDTELERMVALKVPKSAAEKQTVDRFFREARSAAILNHPNICPIYEFGEIDCQRYMTMAYIEGETLAQLIDDGKKFEMLESTQIIKQIAETLDEAHNKGVIHRDLKPSNITIDHRGRPIIMDFGLARRHNVDETQLTLVGAFLGTPAYVSPEQIKNRDGQVDCRTDIYSLGVIFYELLTGERPFQGKDAVAVLGIVLTEEPERPSTLVDHLPIELEEICLKAMAKSADDRYQSMMEFAEALSTFIEAQSPTQ